MIARTTMIGLCVAAALAAISLSVGCVERKLTVTSEPDGALVYLNNQEVGRTPLTRDFTWYGNYDVQLRKEGFQTLKTDHDLIAPWWQWVPFDLVADVTPFWWKDQRTMSFRLEPDATGTADPQALLSRATDMQSQLRYSIHTRLPTTAPATAPATAPTTTPGRAATRT